MWKQIFKEFCINNTCPHQHQKCICVPGFYFPHFLRLLMIPSQKNIWNRCRVKFKDAFRDTSSVIIRKNDRERKQTSYGATVCNGENLLSFFSRKFPYTRCTVYQIIIRGPSNSVLTFEFKLCFCLGKLKEAFW